MVAKIMMAPILRDLSELSKLRKDYEKYKKELGISNEGKFAKFLNMISQGRLFLNHKKVKTHQNDDSESDKIINQAKPA